MTESEWKAAGGIPKSWDDFIWHENATDKASAIANHDDALDAWTESA